jgi:hypothetical protein
MSDYAQTHLQLYRQMQDAGYADQDLLLVDRAYRLAMRIFAGHYRPNNKPFLMHLVGVSGILAGVGLPAFVVAAGLLHSAYPLGLGRQGAGIKPGYRRRINDSLGGNVERLIYAYANRHWSVKDFNGLTAGAIQAMTAADRHLYLVKIADIHEEFLDGGHQFQPCKKLLRDEETNGAWLEDVAALIEGFDYPAWSAAFRQAVAPVGQAPPLGVRGAASSSYLLAPGWPTTRLKHRIVRWLSRH